MNPAITMLWPSIVAGIDVKAPDGMNEALVAAVRKAIDATRVPGLDYHFASDRLDHIPLLRQIDFHAASWWLGQVADMVRAVLRNGYGSESSCDFSMVGHCLIASDGDRIPAHRHPGHHFTVVYYPHVDQPDHQDRLNDGAMSLIDDRPWKHLFRNRNPAFHDGAFFRVHPRTGLLAAFPAYLMHETNTYRGDGERVTLTANVSVIMEREYA